MSKKGAKTKGYIKNLDNNVIFKFQYNPSIFTTTRAVTYVDITAPGMSYPNTQYVKGEIKTFPLELFVKNETSSENTSQEAINFIESLMPPEVNSTFKKPPECLVCIGKFIKKCVVMQFDPSIEMWDSNLKPTQVRINVQFRQVGV